MTDHENKSRRSWREGFSELIDGINSTLEDGVREIRSMTEKRIPPRVFLAKRVVRKMAEGAALYPEEETAEALIGLIVPHEGGEPDLYVLDTIAPAHDTIERESYMVEQGDDLQDEIMYWLAINWRRFRETGLDSDGNPLDPRWDVPLRYLGDWHKQPGDMFWPSHDEDNDMPQIIAPIVTVAPPWNEEIGPPGDEFDLYVLQDDAAPVRINFWYLNRAMEAFVAARPHVLEDDAMPPLPSLAWHLTDHARFHDEYDRLSDAGLAVSVTEWDADGQLPLEVCFMVGRMGGKHVLILITAEDYPNVAPAVRIAPMIQLQEGEDMFERLWAESREISADELPADWQWTAERSLLELLQAVETML